MVGIRNWDRGVYLGKRDGLSILFSVQFIFIYSISIHLFKLNYLMVIRKIIYTK